MTEKLFYQDSHMTTFSATVLACDRTGETYEVVLDRTAFFPTGGGQYADTGVLGNVNVLDVEEKSGIIYHRTDAPVVVGSRVTGTIDWDERFSKMQQHSGEHIVSGLVHETFGYDNVGFHMGKDAITMDFNGAISREQLADIEWRANEAVVKNLDIVELYPSEEELQGMVYRSKIEIEGQVRIVEIPGYDRCACCAPHVKKTGEIGIIKLTGIQNYKGGVRVSMLCGFRALLDYNEKAKNVRQISYMLSAKEAEVAEEVQRLKDEVAAKKQEIAELQKEMLEYKVAGLPEGEPCIVLFEEQLEGNSLRELMNLVLQKGTGVAAVFAGTQVSGYRYVIGSREKDVRTIARQLNEKFEGRGGGKPEMVQGQLMGNAQAIREEVVLWSKEA